MAKPEKLTKSQKSKSKISGFREYTQSFIVALLIALVIRALVIYPFRIPTGSMKDSLLVGDFLLANKFVYGLRSPDWIGIPYTKIGFRIPYFRTPGFRKPKSGDIVIFKYPKDQSLNYIKRCIAVSGDTLEIRDKLTTINGIPFPNAPRTLFKPGTISIDQQQSGMFPRGAGNRDNYGPVRVPAPGDTFRFTDESRMDWSKWLTIAFYEGFYLELTHRGQTIILSEKNIDQWNRYTDSYPIDAFFIDRDPIKNRLYTVKNRHYFLMGDNRDESLDSRYWGFLPEKLVVGEPLIIYWSWDNEIPFYRLLHKIRWNRILKLIH
ncbi:signal peptidase I [candidate division KSB1 bacterium]|nr:signal peptidase I [candidate division KSB1 bacterium]